VSRTREGLPDKLRKRLSGDLDNIVMMAMRKEPRRRYASVEQFSEDLRRHLEGLPVIAHADTFGYRAGKFVRRHKAMAAAAALVALSLVAGIVATSWEARVARAERARAERRFNDVRKLANSFLFEFHTAIQNLPGSTPARRLVVQKALEYLSGLAQESAGDAVLQRELAEAYLKVGDVQGNPYVPNLGDVKGALESYRRALAISEALTRANANDFEARLCLARSHKSVAEVQPILGNTAEAAANFRKAAEIFEALSASRPGDTRVRMELASCYEVLGDVLGHTGLENLSDRAGAIESYRKAMAIDEAVASGEPGNTRARRAMGIVRMKTADMQGDGGDWKAALENYRGALEILQALSTAEPANAQARRSVAMIHRKTGEALAETGDSKRALENLRAALAINERLLAADPTNVQAGMDYALSLRSTGEMLLRTGDKAGALAHFRKVLDILERQSAAEPANSMLAGRHSEMLLYTSKLLVKMGQPGEAHRLGAGGLDVAKQLADRPNAKPDNVNRYAYWLLTCEPADLRNPAAAVRYAERAVESSKGANTDYLSTLAQAYLQRGDAARAVETAERALALLPPSSPARREIEADLARFRNFQPRLSGRGKK
jgi:tetratricopeptide (TPR) repeat protein